MGGGGVFLLRAADLRAADVEKASGGQ
jgi:hypothetical protein